jgi:glucose-6-phosphate dehydrogenase assembly protein OpcA
MEPGHTSERIHLPGQEILDVTGVEHALNGLWLQTANQETDDEGGVVRARALNLLVHVEDEAALAQVSEMLTDITAAHPCRAIVMRGDASAEDRDIDVHLSLQCRPSPVARDRHLCCELVILEAQGRFAVELPSAATPLLVPDLPVILWWYGDVEFSDPVFRSLCRIADRVVIDSADFEQVNADIGELVSFLDGQRAEDARLSDLNWTRHSAWRSLIAAFFDAPENRAQLDRIGSVTIDCVRPPGETTTPPPPGLILAGWLAQCLGWKAEAGAPVENAEGGWVSVLASGDRDVRIEWRLVDHISPESCEIVRVELVCVGAPEPVSFSVELSDDGKHLSTGAAGASIMYAPRVLNCPDQSTDHLLALELNAGGRDQVFARSVRAAAEIISATA